MIIPSRLTRKLDSCALGVVSCSTAFVCPLRIHSRLTTPIAVFLIFVSFFFLPYQYAFFGIAHAGPGVGGKLYFVHTDHLGTPKVMTDRSAMVVWQATHEPFGKLTVNEDPDNDGKQVENNVRFPGQYYDKETGLHYNYSRYYDPGIGRYITSDSIGLDGGLNTYGYVEGNPVNYVDPTGEFLFLGVPAWIWTIGGTAAALVGITECTDRSIEFCERQFPDHMTNSTQKRKMLNCMALSTSGAGQFAGAVTDPLGTAASGLGGMLGTQISDSCNECKK